MLLDEAMYSLTVTCIIHENGGLRIAREDTSDESSSLLPLGRAGVHTSARPTATTQTSSSAAAVLLYLHLFLPSLQICLSPHLRTDSTRFCLQQDAKKITTFIIVYDIYTFLLMGLLTSSPPE
jgi:hypothetical protein